MISRQCYICGIIIVLIILLFSREPSFSDSLDPRNGTSLLKPHVVAHMDTQLDEEEKHLLGYDKVEYVRSITNCRNAVYAEIENWLSTNHIVPSSDITEEGRVRIAVTVDSPQRGELIVLYHMFPTKQKAYLHILFDANVSLSAHERETIIFRYKLVGLKKRLIKKMKCQ